MDSTGFAGMVRLRAMFAATLVVSWSLCVHGGQSYEDPVGDAVARPTDPGADGAFDPVVQGLVDLREIEIGRWRPDDPEVDVFEGDFASDGQFLLIELKIEGLVNPPGSADPLAFSPFAYGEHPIYGFVEIDVDRDVDTGGELIAPQYRYLANVARFGGRPERESFADRVALDGSALDGDVETPPYVDRHGEEFHLALLGSVVAQSTIYEVIGNGDGVFDEGEMWDLAGPFLHRAHAFEPFSFVKGGRHPGEYAPTVFLRFRHEEDDDETHLYLVAPLTNVGAASLTGDPVEGLDLNPENQASILEALDDLYYSAQFFEMFPTGLPEQALIDGWAQSPPEDYLEPSEWALTAILGTSYAQPEPSGLYFVWTDVYPNVASGDFDGDGQSDEDDRTELEAYIAAFDASDGVEDGVVVLAGFGPNFSVFDINYDGVVDGDDIAALEDDDVLVSSVPYNDSSLWRSSGNVIHLTFSVDIAEPLPGELLVRSMLDGGAFGADVVSGFEVVVEQDADGRPRVLKIQDVGPPDLLHREWYAFEGGGDWLAGHSFKIAYVVQIGDVNADGAVLNLDAGMINAAIPDFSAPDLDRRDIDGDGTILNDDVSTTNVYIPSFQVPRPSGH